MKTLEIIECRRCGGSYYGGKTKLVLAPGNETTLPDELYMIVRKVPMCTSCKEREDRTRGGRRKRFERWNIQSDKQSKTWRNLHADIPGR
jgi:hypothetical protein